MPIKTMPDMSEARFRNNPTPTTAPVPSAKVPPKYDCIAKNAPGPTCANAVMGSPRTNIQASCAETVSLSSTGRALRRNACVATDAIPPK